MLNLVSLMRFVFLAIPLSYCINFKSSINEALQMVVTLKNCYSSAPKRVRVGAPVVDLEVGPICPFTLLRDDFGDGVVSLQYGLEKKMRVCFIIIILYYICLSLFE